MRSLFHRLHDLHAARHRGHPHGFFGFGRESAGGLGGGPGGFGRARKLGSADLQLLLLALLAQQASHGYELIKALEERSNGYYAPSPGMVYPALTYLEEIGFATVQAEGSKKLYSITPAGIEHLDRNRAAVNTLLEQLSWIGRKMDRFRRAMAAGSPGREDDGDAFEAPGGASEDVAPELRVARYNLRLALGEKAGASPDEQRRLAAILNRAAEEIRAARGAA